MNEYYEAELLTKATAAQSENPDLAIKYIDEAIKSYLDKGEWRNAFPAYKKKGAYLFKAGKADQSWKLYNELLLTYADNHIFIPQVYDEMRKQLEREKKYIDALALKILSEMLLTRSRLIQNNQYQDNYFDIDYSWVNDDKFHNLSKKAGIDWKPVKNALVDIYKNIDHESDFTSKYLRVRDVLKSL